jgi:hypothetical protein
LSDEAKAAAEISVLEGAKCDDDEPTRSDTEITDVKKNPTEPVQRNVEAASPEEANGTSERGRLEGKSCDEIGISSVTARPPVRSNRPEKVMHKLKVTFSDNVKSAAEARYCDRTTFTVEAAFSEVGNLAVEPDTSEKLKGDVKAESAEPENGEVPVKLPEATNREVDAIPSEVGKFTVNCHFSESEKGKL